MLNDDDIDALMAYLHKRLACEINAQALAFALAGIQIVGFSQYTTHKIYIAPFYDYISIEVHSYNSAYLEHEKLIYNDPEFVSKIIKLTQSLADKYF